MHVAWKYFFGLVDGSNAQATRNSAPCDMVSSDELVALHNHLARCKSSVKQCAPCLYLRTKLAGASVWLVGKFSNGAFKAGCSVCADAGLKGPFAAHEVTTPVMMRHTALAKHETSKSHVAAETQTLVNHALVPDADVFEKVLKACRSGNVASRRAEEIGISPEKFRKLKWCLAEAHRRIWREFLSGEKVTLALHQDGRKQWLCVKFTACDWQLERMQGLFSMLDTSKSLTQRAEVLRDAAKQGIKNFCTPRLAPPQLPKPLPRQPTDTALADKIYNATEIFNADAAADEQLAGQMLRTKPQDSDMGTDCFPNILIVHKDKAHAARRLTSTIYVSLIASSVSKAVFPNLLACS